MVLPRHGPFACATEGHVPAQTNQGRGPSKVYGVCYQSVLSPLLVLLRALLFCFCVVCVLQHSSKLRGCEHSRTEKGEPPGGDALVRCWS